MLRFLKKHIKSSKNLVPPENLPHQNTDVGAECGRDTEGEHRSRDLRADMADGTDLTIVPDPNHGGDGGGSRMANHDGRVEDQQLPMPNASTQIPADERANTSEHDRL